MLTTKVEVICHSHECDSSMSFIILYSMKDGRMIFGNDDDRLHDSLDNIDDDDGDYDTYDDSDNNYDAYDDDDRL